MYKDYKKFGYSGYLDPNRKLEVNRLWNFGNLGYSNHNDIRLIYTIHAHRASSEPGRNIWSWNSRQSVDRSDIL